MERQSAREQRSMTLKAFHLMCQAGTRQEDPLFLVITQVGCIYTVNHTRAIVLDCKLRKDEHTCVSGICREWLACKVLYKHLSWRPVSTKLLCLAPSARYPDSSGSQRTTRLRTQCLSFSRLSRHDTHHLLSSYARPALAQAPTFVPSVARAPVS